MEHPRVVDVLGYELALANLPIDLNEVTYYVGHETMVSSNAGKLNKIAEHIFSYLQRNAVDVASTFCLPARQVVEIGTQVDI